MNSDAVRLWALALADLSADEIIEAITRFSRESTEFPTPAAVRRYAGRRGSSDEDRARIAWVAALRAVRTHGVYVTVDFDDPLVNATIRLMGGWRTWGDWPEQERVWKQKEFVATYETISRSGCGDGSPLVGLIDATNRANGHQQQLDVIRIETGLPPHPVAAKISSVPLDRRSLDYLSATLQLTESPVSEE